MPLSRTIAEFNKKYTNRVTRRFAAVLPGFGIVTHRGRRSGRSYSIPVNVFRAPGGWVFALTYGQGDWVQNVLAANGAELHTRGHDHHVVRPRVVVDPTHAAVPLPVGWILRALNVDEFLYVDEVR
jgi:deazaflavin-dependent oxidoreductase (nitroreductase family)